MKFKDYIEENGLRVAFVAKKLRVVPLTVYKVMQKKHPPSLEVAYRIVKFTKGSVTIRDLLPDDFDETLG